MVQESLSRAYFERLDESGNEIPGSRIEVQFNPTELSIGKGAQIAEIAIPGIDSPILQFVRGQNEKVTLELFFDTTEDGTGTGATPVTTLTNKFYALVKMSGNEHAPPRCRFGWGDEFPGLIQQEGTVSGTRKAFDCIVESVEQRFTLFSPEGVPLRAPGFAGAIGRSFSSRALPVEPSTTPRRRPPTRSTSSRSGGVMAIARLYLRSARPSGTR
jgi:hypothetical protein